MARLWLDARAPVSNAQQQLEAAREQALENEITGSTDACTRLIDLQRENKILSNLVKQYEATIEVIMGKFRLQTDLVHKQKIAIQRECDFELAKEKQLNDELRKENIALADKLQESVDVVRFVLANSEDEAEGGGMHAHSLLHKELHKE
ncbi:hypothetical protein BC830DRAFT_1144955 [Chytriomyces sp. MP71]|nr:hypothetical protein BC830DRAFT_1144955 [Chytriomyces sp. MP71]